MKRIYLMGSLAMALSLSLFSCTDENSDPSGDDFKPMESDGNGNGYLLAVYHPVDGANSNDGGYVAEVTGMPQTQATEPFKAPIDESPVKMQWHHVTAMESGLPMKFPDGEAYDLIYPEVTIPRSAFRTNPNPYDTGNKAVAVRVESTIGVMGTGLLDAITEEDLKAQYASTANYYKNVAKVANVSEYVNPNFWDASADDFAAGAWYTATKDAGVYADGGNGKPMVKRFTYALTRATLQDGPGANAIWNITNVTRPDRPKLYTTNAWAAAMAEDKEVIEKIKNDPTSPFWASTDDEISKRVNGLLKPGTNQFSNEWHNFEPEMSADHFYEFMVWHRGLAATNGSGVERLHDCRARNEVEAIMWHAYSKNSHAYNSALKFYNLSKADRDAVVMFLRSI